MTVTYGRRRVETVRNRAQLCASEEDIMRSCERQIVDVPLLRDERGVSEVDVLKARIARRDHRRDAHVGDR